METLLTSLMDDKDDTPSSNLDFAAPPYVPRQGASPLGGDVVPRSTGSSGDLLRAPPDTHTCSHGISLKYTALLRNHAERHAIST